MADDVFPDEVFDFSVADLMVCLSFHLFGEVVCDCEHVYTLAGCCRKLSHIVHSLLHEGPWREDGPELFRWKVRTEAKHWQLSQHLTWLVESERMVGQ